MCTYILVILLCTLLITITSGGTTQEVYQNSTELCQKKGDDKSYSLDCTNKGFTHIISNWPGQAEKIKATFSLNNITTLQSLPGSDAELQLVFDNCGIKYLDTGLFESCPKVTYVDLSHNFITSEQLGPDVFKGPFNNSMYRPISIRHLNLAYNNIHSLNKNVFEHTPDLQVLNLEGNNMRVLDFVTRSALSSIKKLQVLNLANNALIELNKDAVNNHKYLRELDLSKNDLDLVPYTLGYVAESLQKLKIDDNPIIELLDTTFVGLTKLKELSANNLTKLTVVRALTFKPLVNLQTLHLSNNSLLNEIDREAFGKHPQLKEVYLNNNGLTTLHSSLLKWSQLEVFELNDNALTCDCELYNISEMLSDEIKRHKNGPVCVHPRKLSSVQVYELTKEICLVQPLAISLRQNMYNNVNILRMALVTTSVVLIVVVALALLVIYSKFKGYRRSREYPYPSQVVYTPLAT